ncbi:DUF3043 domain-containing protein [Williamsia sp. SKLECPSW1]
MKLPWKNDTPAATGADAASARAETENGSATADGTTATATRTTQGKGRPTPKRREAEARRRGPVTPAPLTRSEARARRKELKGPRKSRAERKAAGEDRKTARVEQRQKMMDGDERYLMPRDKGPVRRYARDVVDSRRNFAGLFMPFAILLIVVMFLPAIAVYATLLMLVFAVFLAIDAFILGRLVNKRVRERFPDSTDGGFTLGWYSFSRSMQMRFMRAPRPQVKPGDAV